MGYVALRSILFVVLFLAILWGTVKALWPIMLFAFLCLAAYGPSWLDRRRGSVV